MIEMLKTKSAFPKESRFNRISGEIKKAGFFLDNGR